MDFLTVLVACFAVFVAVQPGSWIRVKWDERQSVRRTREAVVVRWEAVARDAISLDGDRSQTQLFLFSDYECPFCRRMEASLDSALTDGLKVGFVPMPRATTQFGIGAAIAVICAEAVGAAGGMHRRLMTTDQWQADGDWVREARTLGIVPLAQFEACTLGSEARARVARLRTIADSAGVTATPTVVSRSGVMRGVPSRADLTALASRAR